MWDALIAIAGANILRDEELSRREHREKYGRWPDKPRPPPSPPPPPKRSAPPSICPHCHSREFKYHQHRLICSYCRTGI